MANMSYCRWENTAADMQDCVRAQVEFNPEDASSSERVGYERALSAAMDMLTNAADAGHLDDMKGDVRRLVETLEAVNG